MRKPAEPTRSRPWPRQVAANGRARTACRGSRPAMAMVGSALVGWVGSARARRGTRMDTRKWRRCRHRPRSSCPRTPWCTRWSYSVYRSRSVIVIWSSPVGGSLTICSDKQLVRHIHGNQIVRICVLTLHARELLLRVGAHLRADGQRHVEHRWDHAPGAQQWIIIRVDVACWRCRRRAATEGARVVAACSSSSGSCGSATRGGRIEDSVPPWKGRARGQGSPPNTVPYRGTSRSKINWIRLRRIQHKHFFTHPKIPR